MSGQSNGRTLRKRQSIIDEAANIVYANRQRDADRKYIVMCVTRLLDWIEQECTNARRNKQLSSKELCRLDLQIRDWVRKGIILLNKNYFEDPFLYDILALLTVVELMTQADAKKLTHMAKRKPIRSAYARKFATEAALNLCYEFGIKPTKAKRGVFCRLAAVLHGDRSADLQYHCIKVLSPGYSTSLMRLKPGQI
jgi:hypothetical protein